MADKPANGRELLEAAIVDPAGSGVFYVFGTNDDVMSGIEQRVCNAAPVVDGEQQDLDVYDARDLSYTEFGTALENPPTFAKRRIIIIECADKMNEGCRKVYVNYCAIFLEDVLLVFMQTPHTPLEDEAVMQYHSVISVECN